MPSSRCQIQYSTNYGANAEAGTKQEVEVTPHNSYGNDKRKQRCDHVLASSLIGTSGNLRLQTENQGSVSSANQALSKQQLQVKSVSSTDIDLFYLDEDDDDHSFYVPPPLKKRKRCTKGKRHTSKAYPSSLDNLSLTKAHNMGSDDRSKTATRTNP